MNVNLTQIEEGQAADFDEGTLRRTDLNLLIVFAMVAKHGSVQAAAGRLYLGASGVSMALNRLRSITSDRLFVRGRHGLEPTPFARLLYQRITPALAAITGALTPQHFEPREAVGTMRLALSEDLEIVLAPRLERALAEQAAGFSLTVRQGDYRRVAMLLDEDVADLVVTARPASVEARHRSEDVLTESFVVLSDRHERGPNAPSSLDAYLRAPHALVSASGASRGRIDETLSELGLSRTVRVVTESFAALPFILRDSDLIANVPRTAAIALAEGFGLAIHEMPIASPSFPIALTWRRRDDGDAALGWMRNLVRDLLVQAAAETSSLARVSRGGTARARPRNDARQAPAR